MTTKTLTEFLADTADQNQSDAPWELEIACVRKVNLAAGPCCGLMD